MSKKIVFMGTPEFSVQTLKELASSSYTIECVYSQPPSKSSRGQKIKPSPVQVAAESLGLNFRSPNDLKDESEYEFFKSLKASMIVVVAYGKIIPKKYLDLKEKFFLNIHASLLPKWRGAAPMQRSIMSLDRVTGISFMKIEEGLDQGPFMKQIQINIDSQTTTKSLSQKLSLLGAKNILECLDLIDNNKANFTKQKEQKATYAKKISKQETKINWEDKAENVLAKINGLNPSPGAWFEFEKKRYKVWKAELSKMNGKPGEIIDEKITVACKNKSIKILEIQKEGKNKLSIDNFIVGSKMKKGGRIL